MAGAYRSRTVGTQRGRAPGGDHHALPCDPRRSFVAQTENTVPRSSPGPKQERPDAGRSPGSRVITWCTAFPGLAWLSVRPSGWRSGA